MTKEINLFDQGGIFEDSVATLEPPKEKKAKSQAMDTDRLVALLDRAKEKQEKTRVEDEMSLQVKKVIEALLFATSEPITFQRLREITDTVHPFKPRVLTQVINELKEEYLRQQRAFRLEETEEGFILRSCEEYSPYIQHLYRSKRGEKLSQASTEVLAIIAYKQPVTRPAVDAIRGVDSSGTIYALMERGLIEKAGRLDAPGKPTLYVVTQQFMQYYGLRNLNELPPMEAVKESS
jgi:segregation and condensation protein B